jgi:TP901 family phage tail tape measure protein
MAKRVVAVELQARVAEYNANMVKAAQATKTVGTEAEKLTKQREAFQVLGRSMVAVGGLMAAGLGVAVKKFADFDQAMSNVAATGKDARDSMQALRDAAIDAGAKTVFSATESANAIEELAKAGVDAKDILGGGLKGALDLAAAGGLGVADAAGIAATALKTFNLRGSDMSHVADLLAAGAGKAMGDVNDLSQALAQGGLVAKATGLSIEETTAALSAFASKGLLGSDAGTSLKTMLQRLTPQSDEAAETFRNLGVSAYDANGQFIGLAEFAGKLQTAMADMTPEARNAAMSVMFGSDAVRAANVLYAEGEDGIRGWIKAVDDQGYAAETAATRLDNLKGDIEALGGAIDSALITMGSAADGPLRGLVQAVTAAVDGFNELPDGAQQAAFWVGAMGTAATVAGGAFFLAIPKIAAYKAAVETLGVATQKTIGRLGKLAAVGGSAMAGLAIGAAALEALKGAFESMGPSAEEVANGITTATDAMQLFKAVNGDSEESARLAAYAMENLSDILDNIAAKKPVGIPGASAVMDLRDIGEQLAQMDLERASRQFALLAETAGLTRTQQMQLLNQMPAFKDALVEEATNLDLAATNHNLLQLAMTGTAGAAGEASAAEKEAAEKAEDLRQAADEAADQLDQMRDALDGVAGSAMDMGAAKDDAIGAINAMRDAAKEEKASLKGSNDESIKFRDSLRDVERAHRDSAEAIINNGGSLKDARREWQNGREAVLKQLEAMGLSRKEARKWADENLGSAGDVKGALNDLKAAYDDVKEAAEAVPDEVDTTVKASGINTVIDQFGRLRTIISDVNGADVEVRIGGRVAKADGGAVYGPGTGTSDSIPALLSNGEHVIPADEVQRAGGQRAVYAARAALMAGGPLRFASGGAVTRASSAAAIRVAERELANAEDAYEDAKAAARVARSKEAKQKAERDLSKAKSELQEARRELRAARSDASGVRRSFRDDRVDWRTSQRRGENFAAGMGGNGLSLVDEMFDLAARLGGKTGAKLRDRALKSEKQYLALEDAAEKASKRLDDLKNAAASMAAGVSNAVRSFFNLGNLGASSEVVKTRSRQESVTVGGRTYTFEGVESYTETTGPTVGSILAGTKAAAKGAKAFADKLKRLAGMGVNGKLLEEIALLGVENGGAIADVLLTATAGEISDLNAYYRAVGKYSDAAGATVADANFEALIATAQKNNDSLQKKLESETTRVIKAITDALNRGVKKAAGGPVYGPGTGTSDSIPAFLSNGENVWSAAHVDAWGGQAAVERLKRMGPARFAKGGPVLVPSAQAFTGGSLSLDGMHITGTFEIGGDGLGRIIDGRVEARQQRAFTGLRAEVAEW